MLSTCYDKHTEKNMEKDICLSHFAVQLKNNMTL